MEKKYIDADYLTEGRVSNDPVVIAVKCAPAADVQEVKHGEWVLVKPRRKGRNATYKCTVCNQLYSSYYNDVQEWTHCPCGARMDGGNQ